MRQTLWVMVALTLGCTETGTGDPSALSTNPPVDEPGDGCELRCSPYDPSVCETFCPPPPPDAPLPTDPYHSEGPR